MMRTLLLGLALMLSACGLKPMYAGGGAGPVAGSLRSIEVQTIPGKAGWLMHKALVERLGAGKQRYRLPAEVELDDNITGWNSRRQRRNRGGTPCAPARLVGCPTAPSS
jgi:LPS-assembly lipoprotein